MACRAWHRPTVRRAAWLGNHLFDPYLDVTNKTAGRALGTTRWRATGMTLMTSSMQTSRYMIAEVSWERSNGHAKECYEDWAVHESKKNIKRELAKNGCASIHCYALVMATFSRPLQATQNTLNYKLRDSKHASGLELVMDESDPKALEYLLGVKYTTHAMN